MNVATFIIILFLLLNEVITIKDFKGEDLILDLSSVVCVCVCVGDFFSFFFFFFFFLGGGGGGVFQLIHIASILRKASLHMLSISISKSKSTNVQILKPLSDIYLMQCRDKY